MADLAHDAGRTDVPPLEQTIPERLAEATRRHPDVEALVGHSVMRGHWDDPVRTAEAIDAQGWMRTGDLAVMAEDGYRGIVGRITDMVIRGGENDTIPRYVTVVEAFPMTVTGTVRRVETREASVAALGLAPPPVTA